MKHEDLENALYTWIQQMSTKNATITGDISREQSLWPENEHDRFQIQ